MRSFTNTLITHNHFACSLLLVLLCFLYACSTPGKGLFAGKTAHERYAEKITNAGLKQTILGQSWFSAANKGLQQPVTIKLPYREAGYFEASQPDAAGYRFAARRGDKVQVQLNKKPTINFTLFIDLWQPIANEQPKWLAAADMTSNSLAYEIRKDGDYVLRIQPELLAGGEYTLVIRTGPSLDFPVAAAGRPKISSFWGAERDAGACSHEGIDIFDRFCTPTLAAADGNITSVSVNKLGGKVVFMRPKGKDFVLYYAHLDSQMVEQGQSVKVGDTIGLMGNTGNARTTPPHLHFGIYAAGGAIDPLPFVDTQRQEPAEIDVTTSHISNLVRSEKNAVIYTAPDKQSARLVSPDAGTLLQVRSATGIWYKVRLPDNVEGFIAGSSVQSIASPLRTIKADSTRPLLDRPDILAASKAFINKETSLKVLGVFNNFYYVGNGDKVGWVTK